MRRCRRSPRRRAASPSPTARPRTCCATIPIWCWPARSACRPPSTCCAGSAATSWSCRCRRTSTACAPPCARWPPPSARSAKGEALIAEFDRRLAALAAPAAASPPTAVIYQIGGTVSGPGSLADAALAAAGFRNMSADYRLTRGGQVPLESLVAKPPDLLVLASNAEEYRTALADNLRHPVIRLLRQRGASLELPWRYWLCGTPHIADAIERLAEARAGIEARRR